MDRREFTAGLVTAYMGAPKSAFGLTANEGDPGRANELARGPIKLESFDYQGVTLLPGQFLDQTKYARERYFNLSNDDILHGFRKAAGMPAPGAPLKGWCRENSSVVFGQWLSGMARLSRATDDTALREKAITLATEWEKTLGPGGNARMNTYQYEKMCCGLVDLALYADFSDAMKMLQRITVWAGKNFDRSRSPATPLDRDGRKPKGTLEWYTLTENSLRAYLLSGDSMYLDFAKLWTYDSYWNKFENTRRPVGAAYLHSYSHMNTFSGAAMMYRVTGDPRYLRILQNAYDWARETQIYASGGYGPGEWSVPADGTLGNALDLRLDTAEIPCGSWAGFKISRYLMGFTGEARYGDWIETLLYNGIGAALPIQPDGRSFYYADYRVGMGTKMYFWDEWPCCSGTYIQAIADYHNIIYFKDEKGLAVNLFVPSEVAWKHGGKNLVVRQETTFPASDETKLSVTAEAPTEFALRFRVPSWAKESSVTVNERPVQVDGTPGQWAEVRRTWQTGDTMTVKLAMTPYLVPVDIQRPQRVAVKYGPVMLAENGSFSYPLAGKPEEVVARFQRTGPGLHFRITGHIPGSEQQVSEFRPFSEFAEREPYRIYFDLDRPRFL